MANSTTEELGWDQDNETWNGDNGENLENGDNGEGGEAPAMKDDPEPDGMTREEADGASSTSSTGNPEKDRKTLDLGLEEFVDDFISSNSILEELCSRLQLSLGLRKEEVQVPEDSKHRLCMPKLKLDKLDDDWILGDEKQESETKVNDDLIALRNASLTLDVIVSEAIFSETFQELSEKLDYLSINSSSSSSSISCDCESCETTHCTGKAEQAEVDEVRIGWSKVKDGLKRIYVMVYKNVWNDPDQIAQRPDMGELRKIVAKLMKKNPFILTLTLQETLKGLIQRVTSSLHNVIKEYSKSPSLASLLISGLIDNYDRIRTASNVSAPIFVDLENEYLSKFSVTWDLINKQMYHFVVASDSVLANNLPICVSQLRKSFPDKSVESRNFALVRRYLDFDVDMGNVAAMWEAAGAFLSEAEFEETVRSAQEYAFKDDLEKYAAEKKRIEKGLLWYMCAQPPSKCGETLENLGESLNKLLENLDNVGELEKIPASIERDLLQAMDLESPFLSPGLARKRLANDDDGNDGDDEVSLEEDLPFPFSPQDCDHVATLLGLGLLKPDLKAKAEGPIPKTSNESSFKRDISQSNVDQIFDLDEDEELQIQWFIQSSVRQGAHDFKAGLLETVSAFSSKNCQTSVAPSFASLPDKLIPVEDENCLAVSSHQKRIGDVSLSAGTEPFDFCSATPSHTASNSNPIQALEKCDASSSQKGRQSLSSTFPSILTAEGPKNPSTWQTEELEKTIDHRQANSSPENVQPQSMGHVPSLLSLAAAAEKRTGSIVDDTSQHSKSGSSCTDGKSTSPAPTSTASNSAKPKTKKSSTEIKQLFQQHYCSSKNKKKHPIPSAGAIRKGKVPPPPTCVLGDDDSTDELSEDSSSLAQDDTCSSASSMASHNANGAKQCSCCYCEFLGHNPNGVTTQLVAPVSRNYTTMRERLRLLLNKKKKSKQVAQTVQPQAQQIQKPKQSANPVQESVEKPTPTPKLASSVRQTAGSASKQSSQMVAKSSNVSHSSPHEAATKHAQPSVTNPSVKDPQASRDKEGEVLKVSGAMAKSTNVCNERQNPVSSVQSSPVEEHNDSPANHVTVTKTLCPTQDTSNPKAPRAPTPGPNPQKRSQSATALTPSKLSSPVPNQLEKSQSAVASQSNGNSGGLINLMDLNELVDFIEGTGTSNEKRRAKKERQKLQRIEIIKANEREARIKREAEEAERRRREEEERAEQERERLLMKKQKKKAAQKAKKALEKGVPSTDGDDEPEKESHQTCQTKLDDPGPQNPDTGCTIEELRARQEQELYELLIKHRKQLEEEEKKHLESLQSDAKTKKTKKGNKKGANAVNSTVPSSTPQPAQQQVTNHFQKQQPQKQPQQQKPSKQQTKLAQQQWQMPQINASHSQGQSKKQQQQQLPVFEPKPTQIKIQRSKDGVNFIPIYDNGEPASRQATNGGIFSHSFMKAPGTPPQSFVPQGINSMFSQNKSSPPVNSFGFPPASSKPVESNQPFVTIKRVSDPTASNETVTISSYDNENKLLYTLVNGEIHRAEGAPENLLPRAKPWTPELFTKLSAPVPSLPCFVDQFNNVPQGQRPPLPTDAEGKLDLGRLQLPPGISITKIQGPVPERKFFPEHDQNRLPFNGGVIKPSQPMLNLPSHAGYTATEGLPTSLSGPNVILVDASTLPTREEERLEMERKKGGDSFDQETIGSNLMTGAYPYMAPKFHDDNGYKKPTGPQYLIKNVNGNVTFTPIPGPTETDATNYLDNCGFNRNGIGTTNSCEMPRATKSRALAGETFDDFNSIFAPKDIDMGEIDEDEREIEAFKRFCFDSIPLQQKTKVNFDMKNLTVKKK